MIRLLTALIIVLLVIPLSVVPEAASADGTPVWKPRGRCVEVSNRKHRIRINCDSRKTVDIETGNFPFGVTIGEAIAEAAAPPRRGNGPENGSPSATQLSEAELVAKYDTNNDDIVSCGDFDSQAEAQEAFDDNPSDPFRLDQGGQPNRPCESL